MFKTINLILLATLLFLSSNVSIGNAGDDENTSPNNYAAGLNVYLDCNFCDEDYIRTKVNFVNYVRDPEQAEVHILITRDKTGSGGRNYSLVFIGRNEFSGDNDTLSFAVTKHETEENISKLTVKFIKLGLIKYVSHTSLADQIDISFKGEKKEVVKIDPWDFWVFDVRVSTELSGEESVNATEFDLWLSANRINENWKIDFDYFASYEENNFDIDGNKIKSISKSQKFWFLAAKSLGEHWSAGGTTAALTSSYNNIKLSTYIAPAIEYDLFPYSESIHKQLRFLYEVRYNHVEYIEETIFDKMRENLFSQSLSISLLLKQPWGTAETTLSGSHYFRDISQYEIQLYGEISIRIVEGLSLDIYSSISSIHNQISLPKGDITTEEILLQRRELASSYDYYTGIGLSYEFGSIYNNIVNPRFGNQ